MVSGLAEITWANILCFGLSPMGEMFGVWERFRERFVFLGKVEVSDVEHYMQLLFVGSRRVIRGLSEITWTNVLCFGLLL